MLSVIVITKNEQDRIRVCLESVKWADEIVVVDNGSVDKTLDLAKKYTDKIFTFDDLDFASLRNRGMEKARGDWVLYVDSDERVLASLKEEIESLMQKDQFSAYAISRKNVILGEEVSYGPYKKDWVVRLFQKKNFELWSGQVHESAHFKGKLGYTKNLLLHLTHRDIDQIVLKSLEWSKIDAKLRHDSNHPKMSGWRFLRILLSEFFNQGIKRGGFFNGTVGIVDSTLQVFSLFITFVRLWQMQQEKPMDKIYEEIDNNLIENGFK
ncbi:glycosyltransferase family 2 protein [Candidatus Daviesbacteria bacterium]|nr:glycosyltransferase family 2 protein [Candidatus Daviesbacteria bacterium]